MDKTRKTIHRRCGSAGEFYEIIKIVNDHEESAHQAVQNRDWSEHSFIYATQKTGNVTEQKHAVKIKGVQTRRSGSLLLGFQKSGKVRGPSPRGVLLNNNN